MKEFLNKNYANLRVSLEIFIVFDLCVGLIIFYLNFYLLFITNFPLFEKIILFTFSQGAFLYIPWKQLNNFGAQPKRWITIIFSLVNLLLSVLFFLLFLFIWTVGEDVRSYDFCPYQMCEPFIWRAYFWSALSFALSLMFLTVGSLSLYLSFKTDIHYYQRIDSL